MADAVVMGKRQGDEDIWILLFLPNMLPNFKAVICHYVKECIQRFIDHVEV
jgi:hypothetical protein